ncbi:MAG: DUF1573 domain-containing protein, partial [Actinobacteria bacterium]|nr:DUF1573 domain-containing protein [Actinomycetota bacterium]
MIFAEPLVDLDECYQFAVLEHTFEYVNAGDRAVRILSVKAADALGRVEFE